MKKLVSVGWRTIFSFVLFFGFSYMQAADLYVSTQGSDSNPGTSAQPFRTITYAYSKAAAGTTIHVLPGTYTDYTSGWGIHLGKSGTASSPIVLQSTVRGGAIIDGQNASDRNQGFYIDGSYNVIDGFQIRNAPHGGISIWANGNHIINNEIHHNGNPASSSSNGQDGVYADQNTHDNYYACNSIHDNGRTGSNLDHGLYLCGQNETVINNLLFRNAASGLQVAGYTTVSNMKVYNNVIAWNGTSGIILWMALNGVDIKNNMIYQNGHAGIGCYAATGSGVVVDHNLVYSNGYGNYDWTSGGSKVSYTLGTTISADPAFVNNSSASFDPHLSSSSPAIKAGLNLSSVFTTDKDGTARPGSGNWDLGAYIYGSSGGGTAPAVTLTSPADGATYTAPATINLAASVTPNGHTITKVQFYENTTLLGEDATAPYTFTYSNVSARTCPMKATVVYDAGSTVSSAAATVTITDPPPPSGLTFASTSGVISAPFYITNNNAIVQPAYTSLAASGQAVYTFSVTAAGNYIVSALVNAPTTDNNSLFVNIDAQPTDPTMVWDVPVTTGLVSQTVSWRGNGVASSSSPSGMTAQYAPAVFSLSAGTHQLIIRGREGNCQLGTITIVPNGPVTSTNTPPTISSIANQAINAGSSTGPLAFTVSDAQTSASNLVVSASSSNPTLVPTAGLVLGGSGANRTVTVTPASGQTGSATITLTVSDGTLTSSTSFTVTVNALAVPVVTLTSPANGASYTAPASISLAANVTANGHTITQVQFYNGQTLLGTVTAAPYTYTWSNVSAGSYTLSAQAVYDSGSSVASASVSVAVTAAGGGSSLSFASTSGTISAPFYVTNNNAIVQPAYTSLTAGGQATYTFSIASAGDYLVSALVNAPTTDNNSFWVNIDAQPTDPTMVWDVPVTTGLVSQTVSWRGNGVASSSSPSGMTAQYSPKVFNLSAGTHQLIVRGREGKCQLGTITIAPVTVLPAPWQALDIGSVGVTGGSSVSGSTYTVSGAGSIAGTADAFRFLYQALGGDGEIRAQINSVQNTGTGGRVGVMVRETLTGGSKHVFMGLSPDGTFQWQLRAATSGSTTGSTAGTGTMPNTWVRLVRTGDAFSGYVSTDGVSWTSAGSCTNAMAANIYFGLAVGSGVTTNTNSSSFSNVTAVP